MSLRSVFGHALPYYASPSTHLYNGARIVYRQGAKRSPINVAVRFQQGRNFSNSPKSVVRWNIGIVLGCGAIGGVTLSLIKYLKSDRTSNCQFQPLNPENLTPTESHTTSAEVAVNQFGIIQRFHLFFRFIYLCLLFSPALHLYVWSYLLGNTTLANYSWRYVLFAVQRAGPAFAKLGQWASTRRDIFSDDCCTILTQLHMNCNSHTWEETEKRLEDSLGQNWQERVVINNHVPIGSGCVAQVYQGWLCSHGDSSMGKPPESGDLENIPIAVKVLHPSIVEKMREDIYLMKYVASWVDTLYPDVHWVALTECVDEFSFVMEKQLDLEKEAENLCKFKANMTNYAHIKFPTPLYPYVTKEVLIESFEPGDHISEYLGNPGGELQKSLAKIGIEAILDMLFIHNFIHGDLHPGNILVQDSNIEDPTLVLLDCGIATSLKTYDLENLHCVFTALVTGQGDKVADLFLDQQKCATLNEYRRNMTTLIDKAVRKLNLQEVHVDTLFTDLFKILIKHKVRIDPNFTSVMVAMMVIEGLGRSLDPNLDLLSYARPCVLGRARHSIKEHVTHRLQKIGQQIIDS